jgi:hypothetical protein
MSPSPASAPRRRGTPDAFGAARLLYEKTAGRSCRRRARPTFHSTTGVTAQQRAPSDKEPRPTGNLPLLDRPPAAASGSSEDVACAYGVRPSRPTCVGARAAPSAPEAGPVRTAWPPVSTTGAAAPKRSIPATDAGRLALGRAATVRRLATPDAVPARQGCIGARPDASAYCLKSDPNPSSRQPGCRPRIADSCAWIPDRRTIHRPFIHGIAHRPAPKLT